MKSFNWTCPYCSRAQAVTADQFSQEAEEIRNSGSVYGRISSLVKTIRCANEDCKQIQLMFSLHRVHLDHLGKFYSPGDKIRHWNLLPDSSAKPQPEYIPRQLVDDYEEACRIRDLSPKASATLSRRCLQGMIRDFCGIHGNTLYREIEELRKRFREGDGIRHVHLDSVDAIDDVRKIGNIGAHMEKDVNLVLITYEAHLGRTLASFVGDLASSPAFGLVLKPVPRSLAVPSGPFSGPRADRMRMVRNQEPCCQCRTD